MVSQQTEKPTVLVTGGAGYIGSHTVLALTRSNYNVIILDNLSYGHRDLVENVLKVPLIEGDISDQQLLNTIFKTYGITAVLHFSAFIAVGESVIEPAKYYHNNVTGTLNLLSVMVANNIKKFVFSSTCAIYGEPQEIPMTENHPVNPLSPYAVSKAMVEQILKDFDQAYQLKSVIFRYFNASGADPNSLLGEDHSPETHLIPLALLTAMNKRDSLSLFGTDYPTPDGTALRDYIHVSDLADAHILGLEYLLQGGDSNQFNLGNGNGFSVKEVIDIAQKVSQKQITIKECPRRPGDAPILVGSADKAKSILGWKPQYSDLETIINHAWQWHQKRHH